ncbi:hypothetical protein [Rhizobium straminoryzae]|uniref:HTH cro/C1-type domain-containing protein n=1 Tax=Rhizobium straminoryzae TaxID=1387186 RepID=A0A549T0V9_9HYPH|nr:hypothetical protein [Rhizobium straminoryzae]TRL35517.1 hypothetical protein FNA46_20170 [Rhizobium straminoryzae]
MDIDDRPDEAKRLEQARKARNFATAKAAALYFGWTYETYIQHEQGTRGLSRAADRYARAFKVSKGWLLTGEGRGPVGPEDNTQNLRTIPIVGLAGAGPDGTVLFATGDGNFGEAIAPSDATDKTEALEVRGDSMRGVANDGWLIFYDEKEAPREEHMGELCVCFLEDERVLIKTPYPGSQPGLFHLESVSAPMMRDVAVEAFAFVTNIKPRRSAKRFISNNPDRRIDDVGTSGRRLMS